MKSNRRSLTNRHADRDLGLAATSPQWGVPERTIGVEWGIARDEKQLVDRGCKDLWRMFNEAAYAR
jgi:hypothetical protein